MTNRKPYKFYTKTLPDGRIKTIAVSTYAGRTVRGTAICDPADTYDAAVGQEIASQRCGEKIAAKRLKRADRKLREARMMVEEAIRYRGKMEDYYRNAYKAVNGPMYYQF